MKLTSTNRPMTYTHSYPIACFKVMGWCSRPLCGCLIATGCLLVGGWLRCFELNSVTVV